MKRKSLLFLLLLALMAPWAAMAQNELTIYENGSATSTYVPVYGTWADAYQKCEFVVPADELDEMNGGTISQMTFYLTSPAAAAWTGTFQVFLREVDNATISAYYGSDAATIVYEGQFDATQSTMTVEFSDTYTYGGSNLLVGVYEITPGNWKGATFAGASVTGACVQGYSSSGLGSVGVNQRNFVPKTTFTYAPGSSLVCEKPESIEASNLTINAATVTWAGGSGIYNVEYKIASDEIWTPALTNDTASLVELTGLTPATNYLARVQSVCEYADTTMYSAWKSVSFTTECDAITTFPWTEPFESYASGNFTDPCWVNEHISGDGTSIFKINTSTIGGNATHTLQLPDMTGGTLTKLVLPEMNLPSNNYQFVLQIYRSNSTYNNNNIYEGVRVYVSTDGNIEGATELAFVPRQYNTGNDVIPAEEAIGWYEYELPLGISGTCYIILRGESQYCTSTYMDNFSVQEIPTCLKPKNLSVVANSITGHEATLRWIPRVEGQTEWQISLTPQNGEEQILGPVTSTDSTYTLTGLTGVTTYTAKVRAYCSDTDQSFWSNDVNFTTTVTCVAPTAFTATDVTNRNVKLSWTSEGTDWIVAYKLTSAHDSTYVEVPVTENPYILEGLAPETGYTVKVRNNCGEVDGLSTWTTTRSFTTLVAYPAPNNVACDSVFAYTAYLSWNERGTAMDWEVAYKLATDTVYTQSELTPNNHPFLLGELDPLVPGTDYVFKVRSLYFTEQGDTTSVWSNEVPFTTLLTCPAPTELTVIDSTINAYGATLNWSSVYSDSWNVKYRTPAYVDNPFVQEGFNGTTIPTGWTQYVGLFDETTGKASLSSGTRWYFGDKNGVFDSHARTNVYSTYQAWLVTPSLTIGNNVGLIFDVALTKYSGTLQPVDPAQQLDDKFIVMISTDEMDTWTVLRKWDNAGSEYVYNNIACTENGENVAIDLSDYAGQTVYIAFYGESTAAGGDNNLHIDNVAIGTFVPATEWQTVLAEEVPFELTGLNPESDYEVVVEGNCGEEISEESASVFFTTDPSCMAPTNLVVIDSTITAYAATLSWTENGTANRWVIEYTTIVNEETVTETINVTENPYTLTNLLDGTLYTVKVQAYCSDTDQSDWSNTVNFTTMPSCPAPTDFEVTEVTAHTATMVWNGTSDSYIVSYRIPGHREFIDADFENGELAGGWSNEGASTWSVGTGDYSVSTGAHGGTYNAKINHGTTGDVTYLVTPSMDLSGKSGLTLGLWYINRQWISDIDGFGVYYRIDGGDWNEIFATTEAHSSWTQLNQALPEGAYAANCQIGFKFTDGYGYGVGLDDITLGDIIEAGEWIPVPVADTTVVIEGLDPVTTYEAMLQGICDEETSDSIEIVFSTIEACLAPTGLAVNNDSITGHTAFISWTEAGSATAWQICLNGDLDNLIEVADSTFYTLTGLVQDADYSVKVRANCGELDGNSNWSSEVSFHTLVTCAAPTNLTADNIGTESATLMWEGESDSYVVQYMPWNQVGEDQTSTAVMTTYTFDLSEYSGMGSIAIRHYNVTNMFYLNVDDIEVTNAQGETVFSENFEGDISPALSIMDLDGDGYYWQIAGGSYHVNGNYGIISASYDNSVGPLTPDNWLIISNVELGGQISFAAVGQDAEWASENFGVFVSPEDGFVEEIVEGENALDVWDLVPNTPYSWQVKGICGEDESQWAVSFFTTLDDVLVFVTDGDWDNVENWDPAQLPTTDNNVRIEANAIIPAGVVAEANKVTIEEGGSITIKDGGQMKLNSQAHVTMEKEIAGYGEGNGNYYLIASPFSGRTLYASTSTDWNHVDSLFVGSYDLYAFDPTYGEGEEWVNYKSDATHINFQSESQGNQGLLDKEGYLYANQDSVTLAFIGDLSKNINKIATKAVAYDSINKGWALVGNIYACNAYLSFIDDEGEMMEANYWVMNAAGDELEQAETADGIAPLTAAFVYFEGEGEIQISSEEPNPAKYGRTGKFIMNLSQDGNTVDKAVVRFGKGRNLQKMSLKNNSKLYFSMKDKDYAVVYTMRQGEMPVSFKAETAGSYTINFAADGVSFKELVLIDNATETKVDLLANPSYTFETEAGNFAERFTIVYKVK